MRHLKLTEAVFTDLQLAFESSDAECTWYLDLERGQVLMITDEITSAYEQLVEEAEEKGVELAVALAESDLHDWERDLVLEADKVEAGLGESVIAIEQDESRDAYRDMEDFAESVKSPALRGGLLDALSRNRPFRRFKDALARSPAEEERWFAFRDERLRQRLLAWLEEEEIEIEVVAG